MSPGDGRISRPGGASKPPTERAKPPGGDGAIGGKAKRRPGGQQTAGPKDAEIVARAKKGDHDAFRVLVERYQGRAYALALRVLKDEERARDAVQEGFLKAYTSLAKFEGRSSFYTWLYRLVMNQCLDMRRRDRSDREVEWDETRSVDPAGAPDAEALAGQGAGNPGPAQALERSELRKRIAEAIAQLPTDARETLLLREVDGLSYAEIAKALEIPKGTVMSRLHYARKRVQQILTEAGIGIGRAVNGPAEDGEPA